jgi:shikimate kinase
MTRIGPCRVILIGMMGSGKSTVGRAVAAATGWTYADNDDLVRRVTGITSRRLVADRGERAMREAESQALRAGLELPEPVIVAAAAGTILDETARGMLKGAGLVVWLTAPAEALAARASGADHRPFLESDPRAWFRAALDERAPLYRDVADLAIDTTRVSAARAASDILAAVAGRTGCAEMLSPAAESR